MSWVPGKLWILVKPGMGSSSTNESLAVSGGYVLTIFFFVGHPRLAMDIGSMSRISMG
jgi:hypothetical protein